MDETITSETAACRWWVLMEHPTHQWVVIGLYESLPADAIVHFQTDPKYDIIDRYS